MIQGTNDEAAWRICIFILFEKRKHKLNSKFKGDDGFGTVCKVDVGYYSQGFSFFFSFLFFSFF